MSIFTGASTTVVALGGNALGETPDDQLRLLRRCAGALVDIAEAGPLIVTHGNGPQVGQITRAFSLGAAADPGVPNVDLPEMGAMTQGYIGEHLVRSLDEELTLRGRAGRVAALVTRVEVDGDDPAFANPTKPIGQFLNRDMALRRMAEDPSQVYAEDAGRGFRRLVASPLPRRILELGAVRALADQGFLVVAGGGGGIPIVRSGDSMRAVDAVIDKDRSAALLAADLGASCLVIFTAVHRVATGWGTPRQEWLSALDAARGRALVEAGEFAEGSMRPKVEAALDFVEGAPKGARRAIICALADASRALSGEVGTLITA
ncbi:MAG: carbamate kinase [Schaalia hyovaginalis]|uniref:carbamate kinase n=1 Tax=Schaalia hyovaginalis TaxID=29316 RepID=UPI0023F6ED67|nr:carbamate kinase [Schaalia hyovaginalis]MCI7671140.1 carbamate kinase [Schaalia hyovaginalis]MDY4263465.1 carbamate kinase [Schaalia hyovaginalis]MDY5506017.1 carbamate kinase [Schaalia hyovaginalis]